MSLRRPNCGLLHKSLLFDKMASIKNRISLWVYRLPLCVCVCVYYMLIKFKLLLLLRLCAAGLISRFSAALQSNPNPNPNPCGNALQSAADRVVCITDSALESIGNKVASMQN